MWHLMKGTMSTHTYNLFGSEFSVKRDAVKLWCWVGQKVWVFPQDFTEKRKRTFWPTHYFASLYSSMRYNLCFKKILSLEDFLLHLHIFLWRLNFIKYRKCTLLIICPVIPYMLWTFLGTFLFYLLSEKG